LVPAISFEAIEEEKISFVARLAASFDYLVILIEEELFGKDSYLLEIKHEDVAEILIDSFIDMEDNQETSQKVSFVQDKESMDFDTFQVNSSLQIIHQNSVVDYNSRNMDFDIRFC
jgi:hypothetical protein